MIDLDGEYEDFTKVSALEHWARVLVFLALFLGTLMLLAPRNAAAHDWARPDLDNWYSSLMRPHGHSYGGGTSCCSKQDCHTTEAELRGNDWWARLGKRLNDRDWELGPWVKVPDELIVRDPKGNVIKNEAGEAVICHSVGMVGSQISIESSTLYCFVPGIQS